MPHRIFEAIAARNEARVEQLIVEDPRAAGARDDDGVSALMTARYYGLVALAERIRAVAPPLDVFEAAAMGDAARLGELLQGDPALAHAWSPDGYTALHFGAFFGQPETARLLLEAGADTDVASRNAMAVLPLNSPAAGNHADVARVLVDHGADVNARTHLGYTPLHAAAEHGESGLVDLLLERGADAAALTERGDSPADAAAHKGHADLAARLRG